MWSKIKILANNRNFGQKWKFKLRNGRMFFWYVRTFRKFVSSSEDVGTLLGHD